MRTRHHHEVITASSIEAIGLLALLIPVFLRPVGERIKTAIAGKKDEPRS